MNTHQNSVLEAAAKTFELWEIVETPKRVSGWLLHEIWKVTTTKSSFALKLLNPEIMKRPEAHGNFLLSEEIVSTAKENGIPAIPAIRGPESFLVEIEGRYAMAFPWVDGKVLWEAPAGERACREIGRILGKIHNVRMDARTAHAYWEMILNEKHLGILDQEFPGIRAKILRLKEEYNRSLALFNADCIMSHRDMDQKNVLWDAVGNPIVIDWEAAGPINPSVELLSMALYWGGIVSGTVEKVSFQAVISGYLESKSIDRTNLQSYLYGCVGFIEWLTYNVARREDLGNTTSEETRTAMHEVTKTAAVVDLFHTNMDIYRGWVSEAVS